MHEEKDKIQEKGEGGYGPTQSFPPGKDRSETHPQEGRDDRQVGEVRSCLDMGRYVADQGKFEEQDQTTIEAKVHGTLRSSNRGPYCESRHGKKELPSKAFGHSMLTSRGDFK